MTGETNITSKRGSQGRGEQDSGIRSQESAVLVGGMAYKELQRRFAALSMPHAILLHL
jgi:hypothetical protein